MKFVRVVLSPVFAAWMCTAAMVTATLPASAAVVQKPTPIPTPAPAGVLFAGDKVRVTVFDHSDLSVDATVTNAGQIVVPLVGSEPAAGRLPQEVASRIATDLQRYLVSPSVDVSILQQNTTAYFGGLATGSFTLRPSETLVMAMADVKIPSEADIHRIALIRNGVRIGGYSDLPELLRTGDPGPVLQPNDVISFVRKSIGVTVSGAVDAPATVYLSADDPLGTALAPMKFAKDANLQRITISKNGGAAVTAGREAPLFTAPVGECSTAQGPCQVAVVIPHASQVAVLGLVKKAGTIALGGDQSLISALTAAGGVSKGGDEARVVVLAPDGTSRGIFDVTKFARGDFAANPALDDGDVVYVPQQPKTSVFLNPKTLLLAALYAAKTYLKLEIPPKP